jgi:GMP synthase (glutamine-hydrolysing)
LARGPETALYEKGAVSGTPYHDPKIRTGRCGFKPGKRSEHLESVLEEIVMLFKWLHHFYPKRLILLPSINFWEQLKYWCIHSKEPYIASIIMNIVCFTHVDFEGPGIIDSWARDNGHTLQVVRPYKGEAIPSSFDMLIIMGGPQSVIKTDEFPYLLDEIQTVQKAVSQAKPVLGFCLGAQIIGAALGAKTERSPEKEVGVYPIQLTEEGLSDPLLAGFPNSFSVIHWHNDMPGLTKESVVLATSAGCPRQIVRYKSNVYGFQCHLEIDHEGMKDLISAVPEDLAPSAYTQDEKTLLSHNYAAINDYMIQILNRFIMI